MLRPLALVVPQDNMPEEFREFFGKETYVFLGFIPNMEGHGLFMKVNKDGAGVHVYHPEDFRELTEDEV